MAIMLNCWYSRGCFPFAFSHAQLLAVATEPALSSLSTTVTLTPLRASSLATLNPTMPAPTTTALFALCLLCLGSSRRVSTDIPGNTSRVGELPEANTEDEKVTDCVCVCVCVCVLATG
jgi:hypothetical protein